MESLFDGAVYVEVYCGLVGFFAREADAQRAALPTSCEPIYAAFNDGDGSFTRPLNIVFHSLRDATSYVFTHHGELHYDFVPENLNDALLEKIGAIYEAQWTLENFFDTSRLEEPPWNALRDAARDVWNALDDAHRLPFGNWRDYTA